MTVSEAEVQKYFPVKVEEPKQEETKQEGLVEVPTEGTKEPVKDVTEEAVDNTIKEPADTEDTVKEPVPEAETPEASDAPTEDEKATDLATLIFNVLKKLVTMIANLFNKGE